MKNIIGVLVILVCLLSIESFQISLFEEIYFQIYYYTQNLYYSHKKNTSTGYAIFRFNLYQRIPVSCRYSIIRAADPHAFFADPDPADFLKNTNLMKRVEKKPQKDFESKVSDFKNNFKIPYSH